MDDRLGRFNSAWRVRTVLPHVVGRLLDIGCGMNGLVKAYSGEGVGVDVYPWEGVDLVVDDTAHLPFEDHAFDTVKIIAALNHIPYRDAVLREAHRVLRPGGRIITTMIPPRISAVWHFLRRRQDADQRERGMKPGEVWGMTSTEVRGLLETANFDVVLERGFMLHINRLTVAEKAG
jgi:SAM-dependent methyltransferase